MNTQHFQTFIVNETLFGTVIYRYYLILTVFHLCTDIMNTQHFQTFIVNETLFGTVIYRYYLIFKCFSFIYQYF